LEAAEMLGRKDQTLAKHEKRRAISKKISYVGVALITINYLTCIACRGIYYRITGESNLALVNWTLIINPSLFISSFCVILLVALIWIFHTFRHDKNLMGNERWMALHSFLLVLILVSFIWYTFISSSH
jgi:hypothetical protein